MASIKKKIFKRKKEKLKGESNNVSLFKNPLSNVYFLFLQVNLFRLKILSLFIIYAYSKFSKINTHEPSSQNDISKLF